MFNRLWLLKGKITGKLYTLLRPWIRAWKFRQAMKVFLADPLQCADPHSPLLPRLIHGWGNEGWSAKPEYMAACIQQVISGEGPILECGSGLTTILIGIIADKYNRQIWAYEHMPQWCKRVRHYLNKYKISSVTLEERQLKDFGKYTWYDISCDALPNGCTLVICDGPPSGIKGGRYGLVPIMRKCFLPGCTIFLDDGHQEQHYQTALQWAEELGITTPVRNGHQTYITLTTK